MTRTLSRREDSYSAVDMLNFSVPIVSETLWLQKVLDIVQIRIYI